MARVLLTNDKGPDCPLFSTKPIFKTLALFVIQFDEMCVYMGNLSFRIQCLIYTIYAFFEKFRIKNEQISSIVNY